MLRSIAVAALAALLTACAGTSGPRAAIDRELANVVNPSAVIATELAFARMAREEGQWTAFREYAADDAVMFVPQAVNAQEWLNGRADPAQAVQWQPHRVWMSCDGSLAVTQGAAQWPDGRPGSFLTVWQRQRDGGYKWVMDQGEFVQEPLTAPDFIQTGMADCPAAEQTRSAALTGRTSSGVAGNAGYSQDRTLSWSTHLRSDGVRSTTILMHIDGDQRRVHQTDNWPAAR